MRKVDELYQELLAAIDTLFRILGVAGLATVALLLNTINTPEPFDVLNNFDILERIGNGIAIAAAIYLISEAGKIPSIIRRSLKIRHEVAREEARKRTIENAPNIEDIKSNFAKREGFGKTRSLEKADDD